MNTNPMTPPSAGGVAGVQITEEMVERVCAAFAGDLTPAQARRWHKYFSGMLDADDLREVVRSAMSAAIESAAPAGDGVEHLGKDWTPQTMEARLYLMTGERDRYKAIAEQAREQIELRDCRIAELTATPAGGDGGLREYEEGVRRDVIPRIAEQQRRKARGAARLLTGTPACENCERLEVALASQIEITNTERALAEQLAARLASTGSAPTATFQTSVSGWMEQCFDPSVVYSITERGDRLLEEVLELLQAHGYDRGRVPTLVEYVYGRPVGEPAQEVGGVMVTLAAYCMVAKLEMHAEGDRELARISSPEIMAKIRRKQQAKNALHFDTPLPGSAGSAPAPSADARVCGYAPGLAQVHLQLPSGPLPDWLELGYPVVVSAAPTQEQPR